jgi:hypothetical protein
MRQDVSGLDLGSNIELYRRPPHDDLILGHCSSLSPTMSTEQQAGNRSLPSASDQQQHSKAQHFYVAVSTQDSKLVRGCAPRKNATLVPPSACKT